MSNVQKISEAQAGGHSRQPAQYVLLLLKGMAMGAADVVPGVSGGTIAFISGIYDELINSLKRCEPSALLILKIKALLPFGSTSMAAFY